MRGSLGVAELFLPAAHTLGIGREIFGAVGYCVQGCAEQVRKAHQGALEVDRRSGVRGGDHLSGSLPGQQQLQQRLLNFKYNPRTLRGDPADIPGKLQGVAEPLLTEHQNALAS